MYMNMSKVNPLNREIISLKKISFFLKSLKIDDH